MKRYRNLPIKGKLITVSMLTCGIGLILACAAFLGYESTELPKETAAELATLAKWPAANTTAPLAFEDRAAAEGTLRALKAESHIIEACVYGRDGNVFARYSRSGTEGAPPPKPRPAGPYFEKGSL